MSPGLAWTALIAAGLLDVGWSISMKLSNGYAKLGWTAASLAFLAAFVFLLGRALSALPLGTAYVVWTGVGAVGTVLGGAWLFGEAITAMRLLGIAVVVTGIILLRVAPAT
jgi:quaternary ammonium compound-resistance protein SugE